MTSFQEVVEVYIILLRLPNIIYERVKDAEELLILVLAFFIVVDTLSISVFSDNSQQHL